ncbi:MAG: hypothetical protein JNM09_30140 [Blastocatellia bacterium]|nr:hypothetical protein [Blastocatellia bacterium]
MSKATKELMNSLPRSSRKQVEKIVMRFACTHNDTGILPNELDQVYREVIEAVKFQSYFPANQMPAIKSWEQAQYYALFTTPQFSY